MQRGRALGGGVKRIFVFKIRKEKKRRQPAVGAGRAGV